MRGLCLWVSLFWGLCSASSSLQAEVFPLDLGRLGHRAGTLEIAHDPDFQNLLVTIRTGDKQEYLVNFPETAVYFIRLRQDQKVIWQEAVLALLESGGEDRMPRLDWKPVPEAQRYRIWLVRHQIRTQWLETPEQAAHLHRLGAPWLIRVRGISAQGQFQPVTQMTMQWVPTRVNPAKAAPAPDIVKKEPELRLDPNAPDDDQTVYEPEDKDLLSGSEESPMDAFIARVTPPQLPPLKRAHEVYIWLRYLQERFEIDKKDRFESDPSSGLGTGASGQYFFAPNISLLGLVDTHATKTDYEAGGVQVPQTQQKRIRVYLGVALDVLNTQIRTTDWSLELGPILGILQIPLQENEQRFTDYGIRFGTHHFPSRSSFSIHFLKSGGREIDLRWTAPWTAWSVRPFIGLYNYESRQSAGSVTGLFHEKGLRLGLERDF